MTIFITIISFIFALGLLIVFHEFGHYLVARLCDVKVLRFSIGFGRPLIRKFWGKDKTEWAIAAFPIGGYVKMLDEHEGEVAPEDLARSFNRKNVVRRFAIVSAGPIANFLLAILLYWLLFMLGVSGIKPVLGPIIPETPAAMADFMSGDTILKIGSKPILTWQDARWILLTQAIEKSPNLMVKILSQSGEVIWRKIDLSKMNPDDLDANFLEKIGINVFQPEIKPVIAQVITNGAGDRAGLLPNDEILLVNGEKTVEWKDFVRLIRNNPGQLLVMDIQRGKTRVSLNVIPDTIIESGKQIGKIGVGPKIVRSRIENLLVKVSYPSDTAMIKAIDKTWETSVFTLQMLGKMVIGDVSWKNVSGPITIADYAGKSAQMGIASYLGFLALISISLGVLNLLPIPLLDGGHLMYYVIEIIKGSPLSEKAMEFGQQLGMVLLFTLMAFAIYNDINRLVSS